MPIINSSDQPSQTLEEFYTELSRTSTNAYVEVGKRMLEMVNLINELFKETVICGLTSHARLVLQSEDSWESKWWVIAANNGLADYHFQYLVPEESAPWPNAFVYGTAASLVEAKRYLLIAMKESGGWAGNAELERLLEENKI